MGLGGVGKSQLAIEYCYRTSDIAAQKNEPIWVFWIHAETQARVEEDFRFIADTVKLSGRKQPKADIPLLVQQWLRNRENGRWLLVLDNADEASVRLNVNHDPTGATPQKGRDRALSTYLPQDSHGSILTTARNKNVARKLTGNSNAIIEVLPMDKDHALRLLSKKVGNQPDMEHGAALVETLEYMPLAISQAGAFIQQQAPRSSISEYLKEFRKSEQRRISLLNWDEESLRRDRSASKSVMSTWQISFDSMRSEQRSAADLLSLMSFFDRQGIPEWLVRPPFNKASQDSNTRECNDDGSKHSASGNDDDSDASSPSDASEDPAVQAFKDDITILRNYSLISVNKTEDVFGMHSLVQLATRKWLDTDKRTEQFKEQFISRMAREFPPVEYSSNWVKKCQTLFPHAERAINHRPIGDKPLWKWGLVLYNGSEYAFDQRRYSLAEAMAKKSWDAWIKTLGAEHELTGKCAARVGRALLRQGKYQKAEKLFVELVELQKQKLGPAHPATLLNIANMARTYTEQGRLEKAENLFLEVIKIQRQELGPTHRSTLSSMASLASTYYNQRQWKEAEKLLLEVLETYEQELGPAHPDTLDTMHNLALIYLAQNHWQEAEKLLTEVIKARRQEFGPIHPSVLTAMSNLASLFGQQGQLEEAEKLEVEVMELRKKKYGLDYPDTLTSMHNLAYTWYCQKRTTEAIDLMDSCVQRSRKVLGLEHPLTLNDTKVLDKWRRREHLFQLLQD